MPVLHGKFNLQVICATADKASCNAKHVRMQVDPQHPYRTENRFAPEDEPRFIYFVSDPPHLMKTVRNNVRNSGDGAHTRYLWVSSPSPYLNYQGSWVLRSTTSIDP